MGVLAERGRGNRVGPRRVALFLTVAMLTTLVAPATAQEFECQDVFLMFARGSGQAVTASPETDAFFDGVIDRLDPGISVTTRELGQDDYGGDAYPARGGYATLLEGEASWTGPVTGGDYNGSVDEGVSEAAAYMADRASACPEEQFVLGGYSQGAHVMGQALSDLPTAARERVAFVALFGDPKLHTNDEIPLGFDPRPLACRGETFPWRRGNIRCYADGGILESRVPYVPDDIEGRVGSWCDKQDGICTGNQTRIADNAHKQYPDAEIPEAVREAAAALAERLPDRADMIDVLPVGFGFQGVDIAFVIDTTGSMGNDISAARAIAGDLADRIVAAPDGRVALTQYRDHGDAFVANLEVPLTDDVDTFTTALGQLRASGGGDYEEALLSGLMTTLDGLDWREGATKAAIVMADAPGKDPEPITGLTMPDVHQRALEIDPVVVYAVNTGGSGSRDFLTRLAEGSEGGEILEPGGSVSVADALEDALDAFETQPVVLVGGPLFAAPGERITLDGSRSYDVDGDLVSFDWDLDGDGTYDVSTDTPTLRTTYDTAYDGDVYLRVTSSDGGTATGATSVTVADDPLADLRAPAPAEATATVTGNGTVEVAWTPPSDPTGIEGWVVSDGTGRRIGYRTFEDTSLVINDIPPGTTSTFLVESIGANGIGGVVETNEVTITREPRCDGLTPTLVGTEGRDLIRGTDGDDVILGLGGRDIIDGLGGDDILCGGDGDDLLHGREGEDTLVGQAGDDHLRGGDDADQVAGGPGDDRTIGNKGDDALFGGTGDDQVSGDQGVDVADGGHGIDHCRSAEETRSCER